MQQGKSEDFNKDIFNERHEIFTQNRKISPRQIRRAMTLEIFGVSSLLLPSYLAKNSGIFGVAAILAGAAGALGLLCVWERVGKWTDMKTAKAGQQKERAEGMNGRHTEGMNGKHFGKVCCGIGLLLLAAYVLALLASLVRGQLLNERYEIVILVTLAGAGFFGLWKGLESRIRIYEVLFWFLLVPLVVVLIVASVSVTPAYWGMTESGAGGMIKSCLASFLFFALSSLVLLFRPHCNEPERAVKSVRAGVCMAALLNLVIYLILLGIFQQKLLGNLQFPVILLMAVVKLPGEFFERQDALMVGIWFFCLFALFDSLLFYGKELLCGGFCKIRNSHIRKDAAAPCKSDDKANGKDRSPSNGMKNLKMNFGSQDGTGSGQVHPGKSGNQKEKRFGILWSAGCTMAVFFLALMWRF